MSTAFTGFVLLNEAKFDRDKFLKDLKEDWKITLDLSKEDYSLTSSKWTTSTPAFSRKANPSLSR